MRFKVGDIVMHRRYGKGVINTINKSVTILPYYIKFNVGYYWCYEEELRLIKPKQFNKSDLQNGDIVILRNGGKWIKHNDRVENETNFIFLSQYSDNLKAGKDFIQYDIMKVIRKTEYETVFERKEEILDEVEKRYLRQVIRLFRNRVKNITKAKGFVNINTGRAFIKIELKDKDVIMLPYFRINTMYKGMKPNVSYTLEELGL